MRVWRCEGVEMSGGCGDMRVWRCEGVEMSGWYG